MEGGNLREGEALGVSEGRLPFSRSSPPGHAVVQRWGGRKCTDGMWDSGGGGWGWEVVSIGGCGREGGPLAGLFPESGGRNVLMVGPGCAAHFVRKILYSVSRQCIPG